MTGLMARKKLTSTFPHLDAKIFPFMRKDNSAEIADSEVSEQ
jgi:hypothetical protein